MMILVIKLYKLILVVKVVSILTCVIYIVNLYLIKIYIISAFEYFVNILWLWFLLFALMGFNLRKTFKAYHGFLVLYVFSFSSVGHGSIGSGRDKVGIRVMILGTLVSVFSYYYCGK